MHQKGSMLLNKEQVQHQLAVEGDDDLKDPNYDPETDPTPVVIFDSELPYIQELKAVDIVFLLDTTASMNCYFTEVTKIIRKIIWDIERCISQFYLEEIDESNEKNESENDNGGSAHSFHAPGFFRMRE